jgi:hypothetical protein
MLPPTIWCTLSATSRSETESIWSSRSSISSAIAPPAWVSAAGTPVIANVALAVR